MSHLEHEPLATVPLMSDSWQLDVEPDCSLTEATELQPPADTASEVISLRPVDETPPALERILEALLFATREPLAMERICKLIGRISSDAVHQAIRYVNQRYKAQNRPYRLIHDKQGYRMVLHQKHRYVLEWLYGGIKEARLSQQAVETLSIIAYRQPLTQFEIEGILGMPCLTPLRQLIRRGMVAVQGYNDEKESLYVTTQRFLEFFHLNRLEDLPRADDLERL